MKSDTSITKVLIPSGALGLGFDVNALERGVATQPDIICIDGGSTDSGPHYLGTGTSKYSSATTRAEIKLLMDARAKANVPLVIGTSGTCGTNSTVDWLADIVVDVASETGQSLKVARIYSQQSPDRVCESLDQSRLRALPAAPQIDKHTIKACTNIVALAGVEPIQHALEQDADIVLSGRSTDTAVIAALPLLRGAHPGAAWHGAKIAECGALCSTRPTTGVVLLTIDDSGFEVEALAERAKCTPQTVSAHMLYENADPFVLYEPGGYLDVTHASYEALDDKRTRVTGSQWHEDADYTVKLEGARIAGYQTMSLCLLRERRYVDNAHLWVAKLEEKIGQLIRDGLDLDADQFDVEFRVIGHNATLGVLEPVAPRPETDTTEVGVLAIFTAQSQALASDIARLANPWLLHLPLTDEEALPTFAFPFSPVETERGPLYEFCLNHVMTIDNPLDAFEISLEDV